MILATLITFASARCNVLAQEVQDTVKVEIYKRFVDNHGPHPDIAYQIAKEYLQKYSKDNDKYTEYLQKWVSLYERVDRKQRLPVLINQKNFNEAFRVGAQILADEPNYLPAEIALAYAGYLAASTKNEAHNAQALAYARKAIESIERGKTLGDWAPFKSKDDTLAYLNFARGFLTLKTNPEESIEALIKAANYDSEIQRTASTYYFLAAAYETGPYKQMSESYRVTQKPETPDGKVALEKLNVLMDRIIDAYARAIATASADPKTEQSRKEWLGQMTTYYKFRHGGSDVGLTEFIGSSLQKPLPSKP